MLYDVFKPVRMNPVSFVCILQFSLQNKVIFNLNNFLNSVLSLSRNLTSFGDGGTCNRTRTKVYC